MNLRIRLFSILCFGIIFGVTLPACWADRYQISSKSLRLDWEVTNDSIRLLAGRDANGGVVFQVAPESPCWKVYFVDNPTTEKPTMILTSVGAARCSVSFEEKNGGSLLKLFWQGMDLGQEKAVVDMTATFETRRGNDLVYCRLKVENHSKRFGMWEVLFPTIDMLPIGSNETDRVVIPRDWGRVFPNPYDPLMIGFRMSAHWPEGLRYPGPQRMQFGALYCPEKQGLYWGTYDTEGYYKQYYYTSKPKENRFELSIGHFPDDMGVVGNDFDQPYPAVLGSFTGDWYDATQLYRKWAMKQFWTSKGPLRERNESYRWYDKVCVTSRQSTRTREQTVEHAVTETNKVTDYFDPPIVALWYTWQNFDNDLSAYAADEEGYPIEGACDAHAAWKKTGKPGFYEAIDDLSKKGHYVFPLMPARLVDPGNPDYDEFEPLTVMKRNGERTVYDKKLPVMEVCVATEQWQNHLADLYRWLATEYKIKGFYMDTLGCSHRACFDPDHGHTLGQGTLNTDGWRAIAKKVRASVSKVAPDAILLGENCADNMIDLIEGQTVSYAEGPFSTPLWQSVYAGYINSYTGASIRPDMEDEPYISMQMANVFIQGGQLGRIDFARQDTLFNESKAGEILSYLQKLVRYRQHASQFLIYGTMLRPLKLSGDNPALVSPVKLGLYAPTMPAVMHSAWQEGDGSIGLFFTNIDTTSHVISFVLDKRYWNLETQPGNTLQQIDQTGNVVNETLLSDQPWPLKKNIAAKDVLFLCIK